jgi:hypothetical protein
MHTIKVSDSTIELLFKDVLVSDYYALVNDIRKLEQKITQGEKLEDYELEDLEDWKRFAASIEVLMEYYLVGYEEIIENARLT